MKKQIQIFEFEYITLPSVEKKLTWTDAIVWIYWIGALVFFVLFCVKIWKLVSLLNNKEKGIAFSFFNTRYVQPQLANASVIEYHEYVHSKQGHSFDLMLFEFSKILFWFNPIIWFYQAALRNIHEYIADEESARFQGNTAAYALLIVNNTLGMKQIELSNHFFNSSILKKRISMLHKSKSLKSAALKFGIALPLFATMLVFSSSKIEASEPINQKLEAIDFQKPIEIVKEKIATVSNQVENSPIMKVLQKQDTSKIINYKDADKPASYPTGIEGFGKFISMHIKVPEDARKNHNLGKVIIGFVVDELGDLNDYKVIKGVGGGCEEEVIRVLNLSPQWIPAVHKRKKVRMRFQIPVNFNIDNGAPSKMEFKTINDTDTTKKLLQSLNRNSLNPPIYILDGLPISDIKNLNNENIESVSILKNNSATALYGAKGANGVVLITTKNGAKDVKSISEVSVVEYAPIQKQHKIQVLDSTTNKPDILLYYVDGLLSNNEEASKTATNTIRDIQLLKRGEKDSKNNLGILLITTKNAPNNIELVNKRISERHGFTYKKSKLISHIN